MHATMRTKYIIPIHYITLSTAAITYVIMLWLIKVTYASVGLHNLSFLLELKR